MMKIATPTVVVLTFQQAKTEFLKQVQNEPCDGQRNHEEQNAAGRPHIQNWEVPSTQAVFHAVRVTGKLARRHRKLILIDGYHRLSHWFGANECPFPNLVVIVHELAADTDEDLMERVDALARTIDSKFAVKTNTDRWCAALRSAGLTESVSKAYKVGFRANSFFKRVLKSPNDSMLKLTVRAKDDLHVHGLMDQLFATSESEMTKANATEYFHAGVQTALFYGLRKLPEDKGAIAVEHLATMLQKLNRATTSAAYRAFVLTPETEMMYTKLVELASPEQKKRLRAIGNREDYYNAVIQQLQPLMDAFCNSLVKAGKKRIRKVV